MSAKTGPPGIPRHWGSPEKNAFLRDTGGWRPYGCITNLEIKRVVCILKLLLDIARALT